MSKPVDVVADVAPAAIVSVAKNPIAATKVATKHFVIWLSTSSHFRPDPNVRQSGVTENLLREQHSEQFVHINGNVANLMQLANHDSFVINSFIARK